ncbi:MAG: DUF4199 domain-containing protein [Bacteroidota bacterium]
MQTTTTQTALKWGAIIGTIGIIQSAIGFVFDFNPTEGTYKWISLIIWIVITIVGLTMAMKSFKSENEGFMTYGQGLGIGALTGGVAGLLSGIFTYIYQSFIDPSFTEKMKEAQIMAMEERGMSSEEIDRAMEMVSAFSSPSMTVVYSILGSILVYFLVSLVLAAIQKNEKPIFQ